MKRVRPVITIFLLCLVVLTAGLAAQEQTLRVSYNPMPLNLPSMVLRRGAYLEGELAPLGWKVEWVSSLTTGPLMSEALAAGALDIAAVMGESSAVIARAAGNDLVVLAPYSVAPKAFAIVVPAEGGAADLKGLAGKRVGLPLGTTAHYLLARAMSAEGLSLAKVEVLNLGVPDAFTAVAGGKLDAAVLVEPVLTRALAGGKVRLLRDGSGLIGGLTVTAVRGKLLRDNPDVVAAFLRAVTRAGKALAADPEAAVSLGAEETKLPPEMVRKIAANYTFLEIPRADMIKELIAVADFLADQKMIARRPSMDELVRQVPGQ